MIERMDSSAARMLVLVAAAALGVYLSYRLALPFLPALVWAVVLGVLIAPVQPKLEMHLGANVAAFVSASVAALIVMLLLLFIVQQLVREAADGAMNIERALRSSDWQSIINGVPILSTIAVWLGERLDLAGMMGRIAQWLTAQSATLLRGSINQAIVLLLVFYMLFYFLRDRKLAVHALREFSPLNSDETAHIIARFTDAVHATVFGTVMVAAVQGTLGGLMFWLLGLPAPAFWGLVMGLLAIVPVLGAFVVWVPAAIFLAVEGEWARALVLVIWGGVIIATIDNLLYPIFVGNRLKLHTVLAFIGAVGGIILFGASGLVLGPATISITLALIAVLKGRFQGEPLSTTDGSEVPDPSAATRLPQLERGDRDAGL
ncbi:AI-2E family transporter [Chelativorans sp. AA-79]|uniref:AI-2E family transporter n=1 Tax=Chelativorans sp. AA-79 TaxID=3028735 RepID=UPI0023F74E1E|nr:AI-2E family transporter [Chelativorans sp. AA-79]WEX10838.1 AI-2E family transporter [Chelativorans sp. AA-79]